MTPKEKAKELVQSYLDVKFVLTTDPDLASHIKQVMKTDIDSAKQCALIAVDEILQLHKKISLETLEFYLEVKQEIEKL